MNLRIKFFGKFGLQYGEESLSGIKSQKSLELLAYVLLRRKLHSRESLANLIWGDHASTDQSRKYLRNALWQLQKSISAQFDGQPPFLAVDARSVSIASGLSVWSDIDEFEARYEEVRDFDGTDLDEDTASGLRQAVDLYVGPFLEGWFCDWCLVYRERSQHLALLMLDKLMNFAKARGEYESGILYGERILSYDRAREVTHRNLMKLFYLSGDRTSALRQYQLCESILLEELAIGPSERTKEVLRSIRGDTLMGEGR